ncbi:hypothetical protein BGX34_011914 [Mortierella sp. NVP85]|nr:hypothetical protein BGX34_011914 [Mortierella sp. NVP85]
MASAHPLEIREIADVVASYLRKKDVATCIRVSKGWYDSFLPHVWRIVRTELEDDYGVLHPIRPERDAIDNHRHFIQDLTLINTIDGFSEYEYPNIRRLEIDMEERKSPINMNLTTQTPMLVDLKLTCVNVQWSFWSALSNNRHLKHLSLVYLTIKVNDAPSLWKTCMRLESLQMEYVLIEEGGRPKDMVFDKLRQLKFHASRATYSSYLMDVMLQSPMLESLELEVSLNTGFRGSTKSGDWGHLKKLHVSGYQEDADLAFIFKKERHGIGNMVSVKEPFSSGLGSQPSKVIFGSHFDTLVDVDLLRCTTVGNTAVPDILCLCPRLEKLQAKYVLAHHVAERDPWVCQHLRELRIQFLFEAPGDDLKRLIFERLSMLVRLERLTLDYSLAGIIRNYYSLECRLGCGLERLESLKQLTFLWLYTSKSRWGAFNWKEPDLGMEEAEWILEHWKKLKVIKGDLNRVSDLRAPLWSVFQSHGIATEL